MNNLIERYITFRTCYIFVIVGAISPAFFLPIVIIFSQVHYYIGIIGKFMLFILNLYIYAGFIKYSFIVNERKFRKIMAIVIILSVINLILSFFQVMLPFKASIILFLPVGLLLFYGFRLIRNAESVFFSKLSKLTLSLLIVGILITIGMGLLEKTKSEIWLALVIPCSLAGFYVVVSFVYWEFKLFRHLHFQYEKVAPTVK